MKKQLLILSLFAAIGSTLFAQNSALSIHIQNGKQLIKTLNHPSQEKNLACGNDTILYTILKENLLGTSMYNAIPLQPGGITEYSQAFANSGSLSVKGISFYGGVPPNNPNVSVIATAVLYNVDVNNAPTSVIATKLITMDTNFMFRTAMFSVPQTVTGNYAVAIENTSLNDTIAVYSNNAANGSYAENLAYFDIPGLGGWNSTSSVLQLIGYTNGEAFEGIIAPVVSYNIATDFTVTTSPVCLGQSIFTTNTTQPTGIVENYMYSLSGFAFHWGLSSADSTYAWSMGDGTPLQWSHDVASYIYTSAGTDTITLVTIGGLLTNCIDTKQVQVIVNDVPSTSFTYDASGAPTIIFTNTTTGGTTYSWDFGDGSPADLNISPTHTFPGPGSYTVVLSATNSCGTILNTQIVVLAGVGIGSNTLEGVTLYPNPSTGVFQVNTNTTEKTTIEIYNSIGQKIISKEVSSSETTIDLTSYNAGIYSVKAISNNKTFVKQVSVIK